MKKIFFEDLPSTKTPLNADNLNQIQENVENAIEEISDSIEKNVKENLVKILWSNSNPTNNFDAQTVSLNDDISNYDMYCVIFNQSTASTNQLTTGILPIGDTFVNMAINKNFRRSLSVSGNSLTFSDTKEFSTYGEVTQKTENAQLIPTYVIGFNFGLFN